MSGPRILFLTTNDIENPIRGCDRRSAKLEEYLSESYHLESIYYEKSPSDTRSRTGQRRPYPYPMSELLAPFNPKIFSRLFKDSRSNTYDVVVASAVGSVVYGLVAQLLFGAALVVDLHNVDHELSKEMGDYTRFLFTKVFAGIALNVASLVLLTSEEDRAEFEQRIGAKSIVVQNGFDRSTFHPKETDPEPSAVDRDKKEGSKRVLFFGNMSYQPNEEAVRIITENIAPALEANVPDCEIRIAGPDCDQIRHLANDRSNVVVVGFLDDIAASIRQSDAVIVPLRTGGGTRLKIIESLACGTPVISTPKGAQGWPDDWTNLSIVEISEFPGEIRRVVTTGGFAMTEYDDIAAYSWEEQMKKVIHSIDRRFVQGAETSGENPARRESSNDTTTGETE